MTNTFRYSVPALLSTRGAGFGNEVIAWGKAFIGAQELGLRTVHPAWALNERSYRHDFHTSIFDWPAQFALRTALPTFIVDDTAAATHDDYAYVMRDISGSISRKRGPLTVVHTSGMQGGYYGIRAARDFLRTAVIAPRHVAADTYKINARLVQGKLTVALHIRAGDFAVGSGGPKPGQFNTMIPIEWYASTGKTLRRAFGERVQFLIFTDDEKNSDIMSLAAELRAVPLPVRARPLLSDIHSMASADLLICSVSSLSMFAAFISDKPYVWFGPHLGVRGGLRSIWGHEDEQTEGLTASNAATYDGDSLLARGNPAMEDGALGDGLLTNLDQTLSLKDQSRDLIMYGVTR